MCDWCGVILGYQAQREKDGAIELWVKLLELGAAMVIFLEVQAVTIFV